MAILRNASLLGLLCLTAAGTVHAQNENASIAIQVRTGDLDLSTPQGVRALRQRLSVAVRTVCSPAQLLGAPEYRSYLDCMGEASTAAEHHASVVIAQARSQTYASLSPAR